MVKRAGGGRHLLYVRWIRSGTDRGLGGAEPRVRYLEDALDEADLSFIGETYAFKNLICELRQGFGRRFNGTGSFGNGRQRPFLRLTEYLW
jgi:hypothetical protein